MKCVAVIPARGGSKGVPLKNLRKVGGERLVVRAVKAALGCDFVSEAVVSTDCPEIAHAARRAGARIVMRPEFLAGDECSSESAITHVLEQLRNSGEVPRYVAFLQCTSPFTTSGDVNNVLEPLIEGRADSSFLAVRSHGFLWKRGESGMVGVNHDHKGVRKRRQDLEPEFRETGAVYAFGAEDFLVHGNRFIGRVEAVESQSTPFDIDDLGDLIKANDTAGPFRSINPAGIKVLVTDFDGVHTDGTVIVSEDGRESVRCNRRDGLGIGLAKQKGLQILILSKEKNPVVIRRAEKLGVECIHGCDQKLGELANWLKNAGIHWDEMAYVGDDVNDLECLQLASLACCPADAVPAVKRSADLVLGARGGEGCVREIVDFLTASQ